jgi:hypothetical protein
VCARACAVCVCVRKRHVADVSEAQAASVIRVMKVVACIGRLPDSDPWEGEKS